MDTRRIPGSRDMFRPAADLGCDTVPVDLVELQRVHAAVTLRGRTGIAAAVSTLLLLGVSAAIALIAIATSAGWSVLDAW